MINRNKKTILLVDDEILIAMDTAVSLKEYGYTVISALSGEEAIDIFKKNPGIDIILMDIDLGKGMDGTQTAALILKDDNIPIVFLSSHTETYIVEKTEKITSYGYVVKNSGITVLDASIKMAFKLFNANKAVTESEEKYRSLIESSSDVIFCVNKKGEYQFSNNIFAESFGKTPDFFIGKTFWDIYPKEDADLRHAATLKVIETGISQSLEVTAPLPDKTKYYLAKISPVKNADGEVTQALVISTDITERRRSEDALREKESRIQSISNNFLNGMIYQAVVDSSGTRRFTYLSDSVQQLYGISPKEGMADASLIYRRIHADDIAFLTKAENESIQSLSAFKAEARIKDPSGEIRWSSFVSTPTLMKDGSTVWDGIEFIITAQKKAEFEIKIKNSELKVLNEELSIAMKKMEATNEALKAANEKLTSTDEKLQHSLQLLEGSEQRYRSLFNNMTEGFALHDLIFDEKDQPVDYRFLDINAAFENLTGLARDTCIGRTQKEILPDEDPYWLKAYSTVAISGTPFNLEHFSPVLQRHFGVLAYRPAPGQFAVIFSDITERKRTEEKLRESEEQLKNLVRDMQVGVLIQGPHAEILMSNPKALELLGISEDQLLGKTSFDPDWNVIHEDGSPFAGPTHPVPQAIATLKPVYQIIMGVNRPGKGDRVWLLVDAVPQFNSDKSLKQVVCTFIEITIRKRAEAKVQNLLDEKELILKEVHHRIKNNMNTIYSLLNLQAHSIQNASAAAALEDARNRVQSMMTLYDKLYQSENVNELAVSEYIPALIDQILANFTGSIKVSVKKNIEPFVLKAKHLQPLSIIINELLTNIMKYAFERKDNCFVSVSASIKDSLVSVIVYDNGKGIPDEISVEASTGFGLTLVNMLMQQLGGTIDIERKNGTKITLTFPV